MRSRIADFQRQSAPEVQQKDADWFWNQLRSKCPEVLEVGSEYKIICPFHADTNPSCGVHKYGGYFFCFSCKAGGGWNDLAAKLGMEKLGWGRRASSENKRLGQAKEDMTRALAAMGVMPHKLDGKGDINRPLTSPWPEDEDVRGFTGRFLRQLGCVKITDLRHKVVRLGLPVRTQDGQIIAYTCRAIDPEDAEPKYVPLSADQISWRDKELPTKSSFFLIEKILEYGWRRAVLTEGPLDALRLFSHGVPALAILGAANWGPIKVGIISGHLDAVLVLMDADEAGRNAQVDIVTSLQGHVRVAGCRLPEGVKDPDRLSARQIEWVGRKLERI